MPDLDVTEMEFLRRLDLLNPALAKEIRDEMALGKELSKMLNEMAERISGGATVEYDQLVNEMNRIAEKHGHEYGLALPDVEGGHRFIPAYRSPNAWAHLLNPGPLTEHAQELARQNIPIINSWNCLGDHTVTVVETDEGPMAVRSLHAGNRLRKLMDGAMLRTSMPNQSAEAEFKAMATLKGKITEPQWDSYVLNGCFPERSKRSDLHYIFRKGYPTLVISYHGSGRSLKKKPAHLARVIAALCMHPVGYYDGTHVGAMTPTDEVLAHLLLMRGDERKLWAKSGQWHVADPRSGI